MIKVLLADDEPHVLQFLQNSIPWNRLGLELAATARDGETAAQLAVLRQADIVITDIRMSKMDGLALCRRLKEQNPDIQIILISGYAEFSYARQALELGIIGYCLKPIDMEELTAFLCTAVRRIQKERYANAEWLLDCIESQDSDEIRRSLAAAGLNDGLYWVAASCGLHDIAHKLHAAVSCKSGKHTCVYLSPVPFPRDEAVRLISFAGQNVGIGICPDAVPADGLSQAVQTAIIFSYQYFLTGRPFLCERPVSESLTAELFARLDAALRSPKALYDFLEKLLTADLGMLFDISSAFRFYNIIYSDKLLRFLARTGEHYLYGFDQFTHTYASFAHALREISDALKDRTPDITMEDMFHESPSTKKEPETASGTFLKLLKYINANYEKDLSLKLLSETFYLTPSYVSTLVKNETGMTYTQYITNLRMEKAKQLLSTTNLSLAQISEAVGFNDYFYFIKKFKKETGMTPGRFRN